MVVEFVDGVRLKEDCKVCEYSVQKGAFLKICYKFSADWQFECLKTFKICFVVDICYLNPLEQSQNLN